MPRKQPKWYHKYMVTSPTHNSRNNRDAKRRRKREERSSAKYRVSLKAIIRNQNNEVLMIKERGGFWSLPGGGIEHGEAETDALKRELFEEVTYKGNLEAHPVATTTYYTKGNKVWKFWSVSTLPTRRRCPRSEPAAPSG